MNTGKVRFYNAEQGIGYIRPDDGKKDVLFHATVLRSAGITELQERQAVKFDTEINANTGKATVSSITTD
ncbi:MAG: cold shock domain-containing protein [Pseudomonadota bacterium]